MRLSRPQWVPGVWVVAIARRAAVGASFAELQHEWLRLAERAGVLPKAFPKANAAEGGGRD